MENPFQPRHFDRVDQTDDREFYIQPRLVRHIDDSACLALSGFFAQMMPPGGTVLDLMSSYASHLPADQAFAAVVGLGLNAPELAANLQLSAGVIHDVNARPILPFRDAAFDACVLTVSVQYLTDPVAVFTDVARVLKPGAPFIVSFSNRMFPTKAVAVWRASGDADRARVVSLYFELAGKFAAPVFHDLSPTAHGCDPLYAVTALRTG